MKAWHIVIVLLALALLAGGYFFFFSEGAKKRKLVKKILAKSTWANSGLENNERERLLKLTVAELEVLAK